MPHRRSEKPYLIESFIGGENTFAVPDKLKREEQQALVNWDFSKEDNIVPRKGNTFYDDYSGSDACTSLQTYKSDADTEKVVSQRGTTLFIDGVELGGVGNGGCVAARQTMAHFLGMLWFAPGENNGGNNELKVYDISTGNETTYSFAPMNVSGIVLYRDRLWVWADSYLFFSTPYLNDKTFGTLDATCFDAANNFILISPDDGFDIIAAIPTADRLLVVKSNGDIYPVYGSYRDEFTLPPERISPDGPINQWVWDDFKGIKYWLGKDNVYYFDGQTIRPAMEKRQAYSFITSQNTGRKYKEQATALVVDDEDFVFCFTSSDSTVNNKVGLFNIIRGNFRRYEGTGFPFGPSVQKEDGTWITAQISSPYKLLKQRDGYADSLVGEADTDITASFLSKKKIFYGGDLTFRARRFYGRIKFSKNLLIKILMHRTRLATDTSLIEHTIDLLNTGGGGSGSYADKYKWAGDSSSTPSWAEDDLSNVNTPWLVWAAGEGEGSIEATLQNIKKSLPRKMVGNDFQIEVSIQYNEDPVCDIQSLGIYYKPKRRI